MNDAACLQCILPTCAAEYELGEVIFACRRCGSLLDVRYDWARCEPPPVLSEFDARRPRGTEATVGSSSAELSARLDAGGVWRFRELLPFAAPANLVTFGEGRTVFQQADELARLIGHQAGRLFLQYEGFNPSGSFKDNGMAAAMTMARRLGRKRVGCASTGNTSASLALYAEVTRTCHDEPIEAVVFVGSGRIAAGKLAQTLDHGARTIQIDGDFDDAMRLIQQAADRLDLYLVNSVNPFRLEGQKTIMYRVLEGLNWNPPDWIILPGGNLGNVSAFGKALAELRELELIFHMPRLAVVNATGANTLYELYTELGLRFDHGRVNRELVEGYYAQWQAEGRSAKTVASAIEITRPVNLFKALRSLETTGGIVRQVSDEEILDGKALIGRFGFGCEPASGATVAGLKRLLEEQMISPWDRVVCILTGHPLKDTAAMLNYHAADASHRADARHCNPPLSVPADLDRIAEAIDSCR